MRTPRTSLFTALLLSLASAHAQQPPDPSGHWEGAIQTPDKSISIELDLARNSNGGLAGTMNIPEENLKGLPFRTVTVEGRSVTLVARTDQPFTAMLSEDGKSLSGSLSVSGYSVPVSLVRMGEARIEATEKSAPVGKELEGTWSGALGDEGKHLRLVLTLSNQPDGTANARIVNLDEGDLEIPASVRQNDSTVILQFKAIGASYTGTLNKQATELAGTYTQGSITLPLKFQRSASQGPR